ncbi:hypothetical protein A2368_03745 [Candidatus Collierbacteria bacterium RIFOXYB1_FULL_49_13]|uniref:DUF5666 domain-containing protein n=1 Tax=Candidatus Collierbacteria bacterium RIFOXYB1_FULL_49_13 TaxID=1817728 RepID=A0A1F5FIQ3_9BACT|nr:MAG: hypothetical protein A2368_03745 [Candidatus Collierbacteria bacterium RIFOXYB1_FULL_49_13]
MNPVKTIIPLLLASILALSACTTGPTPAADTEQPNTTLSGEIVSQGGVILLRTPNKMVDLHDGAAVVSTLTGKKVTVTGQYSGTTLYVDEVVVNQ